MTLASKIAKAMTKKAEPEALMVRKKEDELYKIKDKYSEDTHMGMAARNEISRRNELKEYKKDNPDWKEKGIPQDIGPNWYKEGMAKGGMVKKKPAAKKAPAKTKSRSNTYNKFYGK
jgi:hypothetical protein